MKESIENITPLKELEAYFRGIMAQIYKPDQTINESKFNSLQTHILEFKDKIKSTHSKVDIDGSDSFHLLSGSTVQDEKRITPDTLFEEVESFIKNTLALATVSQIEE